MRNRPIRTYLLNPTLANESRYIREGRCMQKASSWATAWPPITLATLGAIAKTKGPVRLLDGNVEPMKLPALLDDITASAPDLIVINTGFPSLDNDTYVAGEIKRAFPRARMAAFGVYFTLLDQPAVEAWPFLDFAITGEPEQTFAELLDVLAAGGEDFGRIQGLWRRAKHGLVANPPRSLIDDLDALPFPDRDLLCNDKYRLPHNNQPFTLINTARGCPYRCSYCVVEPYYGRRVRRHSLDYILREIETCVERHGIREFLFWEEVFTLDRDFVLAFCRAIQERKLSIRWAATTRVTAVDQDLMHAMKAAGCYLLGLGIESSCQDILDRAGKHQKVADAVKAVACCRQAGIQTMGHFIFGLPGETAATAEETIRFMCRLGLDYMQAYCAVPYPKTPLGQQAKAEGWVRAETWSQYDFGGDSIMNTGALTCEEVTAFRRRAFRRFYLRPAFLFRTLLRSFSLRQLLRISAFSDWMMLFRRKGRDAR